MRILGIDPGLNVTGYAVLEATGTKPQIVEAGVLRPSTGKEKPDMARRLRTLYENLTEVIEEHRPSVMAVEQLYAHYMHPRTAILMGHARGVIFLAGAIFNISVISYAATKVKKTIAGTGRTTKEQMQRAMVREFNLLNLPEPHDVADALAIALCHFHIARRTTEETR
jgi:crossover junction endodeoxyribonuclease RuvC